MAHVEAVVRREWPDADIFIPPLPTQLFSLTDPLLTVDLLLRQLDTLWDERKQKEDHLAYQEMALVGHSMGALLARKMYACACGEQPEAPFEKQITAATASRPWAGQVKRLILLAGMNRGWSVTHHLSLLHGVTLWIGSFLAEVIRLCSGIPEAPLRRVPARSFSQTVLTLTDGIQS